MAIDYTLPEKPFPFMFQLEQAFYSKHPIICHRSRENTLSVLTGYGYLQEIAPDTAAVAWFEKLGHGKHLNDRFRAENNAIDSNIDNYAFLEITESGKTAIYYNKLLKDKEKLHATKTYDKISELVEDIQELIYSKFNML
jgi:hypothetical protein